MLRRKNLLLAMLVLVASLVIGTLVLAVAGLCDDTGKADVSLVLGSKVESDGTPSIRLRARLDRTLELYRAGYFPTIITSGGIGKEGYDEAVVMRDYLVAHGVPQEHVIVDNGGVTTYASARNTLRICRDRQFQSVLVVSQYFHVPRSRLALQRFGIARVYSAHAYLFELRDLYSAPRELVGYLSYLFRSYDSERGAQP
jgi:vancomycin permeability regulator SanA